MNKKSREIFLRNLRFFVRWTAVSVFIGFSVGFIGAIFRKGVDLMTRNWNTHPEVMFLAPFAGLMIVAWTKLLREEKNGGTNLVMEAITEGKHITGRTAPMIFVCTLLSHAAGMSVGKEGAALMVGGSVGEQIGTLFHFDEDDKKLAVMCGMSACFAAIFGTPLAATVFPMEAIAVGSMYYAGLVPCAFAAFTGACLSSYMGNAGEVFPVNSVPLLTFRTAIPMVCFGIWVALLAMAFSMILNKGHHAANKLIPNPWIRIAAGAVLFIVMTQLNLRFFTGAYDFNGGGFPLAEKAMEGEAAWYAFIFKILFTAVAIFAGFKGGEIVPTLCIGGCFGCFFAKLFGLDPMLYTACGMAAMFAGMTNAPVSSLLLAFELFGYAGMPYFVLAIAVAFALSGYYGLYAGQHFSASKLRPAQIHRKGPRSSWTKEDN